MRTLIFYSVKLLIVQALLFAKLLSKENGGLKIRARLLLLEKMEPL